MVKVCEMMPCMPKRCIRCVDIVRTLFGVDDVDDVREREDESGEKVSVTETFTAIRGCKLFPVLDVDLSQIV